MATVVTEAVAQDERFSQLALSVSVILLHFNFLRKSDAPKGIRWTWDQMQSRRRGEKGRKIDEEYNVSTLHTVSTLEKTGFVFTELKGVERPTGFRATAVFMRHDYQKERGISLASSRDRALLEELVTGRTWDVQMYRNPGREDGGNFSVELSNLYIGEPFQHELAVCGVGNFCICEADD